MWHWRCICAWLCASAYYYEYVRFYISSSVHVSWLCTHICAFPRVVNFIYCLCRNWLYGYVYVRMVYHPIQRGFSTPRYPISRQLHILLSHWLIHLVVVPLPPVLPWLLYSVVGWMVRPDSVCGSVFTFRTNYMLWYTAVFLRRCIENL